MGVVRAVNVSLDGLNAPVQWLFHDAQLVPLPGANSLSRDVKGIESDTGRHNPTVRHGTRYGASARKITIRRLSWVHSGLCLFR